MANAQVIAIERPSLARGTASPSRRALSGEGSNLKKNFRERSSDGGGGEVSRDVLLRRLRVGQPRLRRSYLRLIHRLDKPVADESGADALAAAYAAHRKDVLKLRASVARPRRLILATLESEAAGLAAYRQAALATSDSKAASLSARGTKALLRAEAQAARDRRALGCGESC